MLYQFVLIYMIQISGYSAPLNQTEITGPFASKLECQKYGEMMIDNIRQSRVYIKNSGKFRCEVAE